MPSTDLRRRKSASDSESEQNGSSGDQDATAARKRRKLAQQQQVHQMALNRVNNASGSSAASTSGAVQHQPGAIVRIKLQNFVTYTAVEFFPGPSLNMIIGPNGTGKSTLVCAICIGLGWDTKHLGRAKDLSEFVKHGRDEAKIEIELRADPKRSRKNYVVSCDIRRSDNKAVYKFNGKPVSRRKILEFVMSMSIQIDNLCQFLPQERVAEFAAMTPIMLLQSTQRAVASQDMIDSYESLKEFRKEQRKLETARERDAAELESLEKRQKAQEADVERLRTRDQLKLKIDNLTRARPFIEYTGIRDKQAKLKEERKIAFDRFRALEQQVEPALYAVNAKEAYRDAIARTTEGRRKLLLTSGNTVEQAIAKIGKCDQKLQGCETKRTAERKNGHSYMQEQRRLEGIVADLQRMLGDAPPEFDVAASNEQIRAKERQTLGFREQVKDLKTHAKEFDDQSRQHSFKIKDLDRELSLFDSRAGKQELKLRKVSPDTFKAWNWIKDNKDRFEKPVFGPPMVECSIKDMRYASLIENLLSESEMLTLTVQSKEDFKLLHKVLHGDLRLEKLNMRTMLSGLDRFKPSFTADEMRNFGFDGWAIDYIDGPSPVLASLCEGGRLHMTGVSLKDSTSQQYDMIYKSNVQSWVTSKAVYRVHRRREYGPDAVSTATRNLRPSEVWTDQPVDISQKHQKEAERQELLAQKQQCEKEINSINKQIADISDQNTAVKEECEDLRNKKAASLKALQDHNMLPTRIGDINAKIQAARNSVEQARERMIALGREQDRQIVEKSEAVLEMAELTREMQQRHVELQTAETMLIEAAAECLELQEQNRSIKEELELRRTEYETLASKVTELGKLARNTIELVSKLLKDKDYMEWVQNDLNRHQSMEEYENMLAAEKDSFASMHEGDGGILARFEDRQKKIDQVKEHLGRCALGLNEVTDKITVIRNEWEPELDSLMSHISAAFAYNMSEIDAAGEVEIHKEGNEYDQWSILIKVKFRDDQPLIALDAQRQSGGERAVSTIFYLMALQTLTRSPFRVVDEINQGMDPRNERLVHARIVQTATGRDPQHLYGKLHGRRGARTVIDDDEQEADAAGGPALVDEAIDANTENGEPSVNNGSESKVSQYFLITPKLLHDLKYEPGMRVLCIGSGEFMPTDQNVVDFSRSFAIRKSLGPSQALAATAAA